MNQSFIQVEHDCLSIVLYRGEGFASELSRSLLLRVFYVRQNIQRRRQVIPAQVVERCQILGLECAQDR
jgi:hypothetical protein